jgi:hypothetical protein
VKGEEAWDLFVWLKILRIWTKKLKGESMRIAKILLTLLALSLLLAEASWAVTNSQNLTINFAPAARAKLTLGAASITFPDADPDLGPVAATAPVTVTAAVRTATAGAPTLTVLTPDLVSGTDTIPITNVSWTASGDPGFKPGTMNKTTAATAGTWTGSGSRSGTFTYSMVNSWSYATGTYAAVAVYTLTAP